MRGSTVVLFACSTPSALGWNFGDVSYSLHFWMVQIIFDNSMTVTLFITIFLNLWCFVHTLPKSHPNTFWALWAKSTMYSSSNVLDRCNSIQSSASYVVFFLGLFFNFFPARQLLWKRQLKGGEDMIVIINLAYDSAARSCHGTHWPLPAPLPVQPTCSSWGSQRRLGGT